MSCLLIRWVINVWVGDPKPILYTIYKYYFSRIYLGSKNTIKGLKYYQNVYSILNERINDIEFGYIVTKDELYDGVVPNDLLPPIIQKEIVESINSMHLYNELRMNNDILDFIPVVSKVLILRNEKVKNIYHGENKLSTDHSMLSEFKKKYFGNEPKTIHAEVDAMFKVWRKFRGSDCSQCDLVLITVRNGHNILSRPCKFCRGMLTKVLKELNFKRVILTYPIIDDLIMIEKFRPKNLDT